MSGYLKCTDPDNPNKYILLTEGDIRFYEDVGGVPTPAAALTQINIYDIASGGSLTPGQRYTGDPEPPQVYLEPKRLRTFDYGGLAMDQRIEIDAPTVVHSPSTGKCQITVNGGRQRRRRRAALCLQDKHRRAQPRMGGAGERHFRGDSLWLCHQLDSLRRLQQIWHKIYP